MNLVPKGASRFANRALLKTKAKSPTILVVAGVVGLGATAVMAAKATRRLDPVLEDHRARRSDVGYAAPGTKLTRSEQREVLGVYVDTAAQLTRLYGPAIVVGTLSAASVLTGHRILTQRHLATMAAYTGLLDQFQAYRGRVAESLGEDRERDIYNGAHVEWVEDPNHPGEYKPESRFSSNSTDWLHPWFDETNHNWTTNAQTNYIFLKGVQEHFNWILRTRGHVFLNDVLDALGFERVPEGQVAGWMYEDLGDGDGYVDFGFMTNNDARSEAFREGSNPNVQLNFNIDPGMIYQRI